MILLLCLLALAAGWILASAGRDIIRFQRQRRAERLEAQKHFHRSVVAGGKWTAFPGERTSPGVEPNPQSVIRNPKSPP
jgi:hypothetical protein